ncbi:hypothetical protein INR49_016099, partial [Caranx melampygus]
MSVVVGVVEGQVGVIGYGGLSLDSSLWGEQLTRSDWKSRMFAVFLGGSETEPRLGGSTLVLRQLQLIALDVPVCKQTESLLPRVQEDELEVQTGPKHEHVAVEFYLGDTTRGRGRDPQRALLSKNTLHNSQ